MKLRGVEASLEGLKPKPGLVWHGDISITSHEGLSGTKGNSATALLQIIRKLRSALLTRELNQGATECPCSGLLSGAECCSDQIFRKECFKTEYASSQMRKSSPKELAFAHSPHVLAFPFALGQRRTHSTNSRASGTHAQAVQAGRLSYDRGLCSSALRARSSEA